ncbi:MAG: pyruvate kinase [Anaerolineae bacterium]
MDVCQHFAPPAPWRRTKIVCTLGPASSSEEIIRRLIRAGMDVARINFSHGDHAGHARAVQLVRTIAQEEGRNVAILGDLQGPKLRVGELAGGQMRLEEGQRILLTAASSAEQAGIIPVPHQELLQHLQPGDVLLLDDGLMSLRVAEVGGGTAVCQVLAGGILLSNKGISLPGAASTLPAITPKDRQDLAFAVEQEFDFIALSFVRRADDVRELRRLLAELGADIPIVAKIEKREAVANIQEIVQTADAVMVARGDLGVEAPAEEVPLYQKRIIQLARQAAKPVITATQMLESMIHNPRPTRAEASDVANAILDGTDAVMLSGETAVGKYPAEAVEMMVRIALATERAFPYERELGRVGPLPADGVTDAITQATCEIAHELPARAIISSTMSGYTARMVSRHRPATPILVCTPSERVCRQMALVWGTHAARVPEYHSTDEMIRTADQAVAACGMANAGDLVVITAGIPSGGRGKTNMVYVHRVSEEV